MSGTLPISRIKAGMARAAVDTRRRAATATSLDTRHSSGKVTEGAMPAAAGFDQARDNDITHLLLQWQHGDKTAADELASCVYRELFRMASHRLAAETGAGLQSDELLNEAWIRLSERQRAFSSREHFYAIAALQMRQLLVDLARRRACLKRQGVEATLTVRLHDDGPQPEALCQVAEALESLAEVDARKAHVFVLNALAGFTTEESARMLGISVATLERDLRFARSWLAAKLG